MKIGVIYKMYVQTGTSSDHLSHMRIENNVDGSVTIREKNLKITVLHNEVDMLNYFSSKIGRASCRERV